MFWCFSSPALLNDVLGTPRRHFAEAERGSRVSQIVLYPFCDRVRGGSEHAPRNSCRILERRHGLAEIIERGVGVQLRAAYKEDPSSLSADDRARAEQLLARDARKAAKKAARRVSSETPPSPPPSESA